MDLLEYLNRAEKAIGQNEFKMAEEYYRQILSHFPKNQDALDGLKNLGIHKAKKNWSPVTRFIYGGWASLMALIGKPEKAYPIHEILHQCDPDNKHAASRFAFTALKTGNLEEAHQAFLRALRHDPANFRILKADGDLLIKMDRLQEANERYEILHRLKPNDDAIGHTLRDISANSYAQIGIPEELTARRSAIEKEKRDAPGDPEFVKRLDRLKQENKKNPQNIQAAIALAEHLRKGKLFNDANLALGPVLDANPDNAEARLAQARVWRSAGDLDIAVSLYEELISHSPENAALKDELLEAQIAQLETSGANDKDAVIRLETLKLEREQRRMKTLGEWVAANPDAHKEREELGELYLKQGRIDEAIPLLQRLVQEPSRAGKGFFLLGQCFRALGDNQLAINQYEKALEFFKNKGYSHVPTNDLKNVHYYLGIAHEALGDRAAAREAYGQVYSVDVHFKDIRARYESTFK